MKTKILTAAAVLAAASVASAFTWSGAAGEYFVNTGLDNGTETAGYWYDYADGPGGQSAVTWPVEKGNDYSTDALDPIIDECQGVCGTFTLVQGTNTYDPFVGIGFNVAGTEEPTGGEATPADASAWGGVCITYTVDVKASLEMGLGDTKDSELGYDVPFVSLPKSASANEVCTAWSGFKQAGWGKGKITGDAAAAILAALKFKIQGKDGTSGSFNIMAVSSMNDVGIKNVAAASAVKATLSGRTLSFAGIKSVATAEVMNLQGQVIVKGAVSSSASLDLSSVDAGVYLVRVAGKSVDFSQKIVIK